MEGRSGTENLLVPKEEEEEEFLDALHIARTNVDLPVATEVAIFLLHFLSYFESNPKTSVKPTIKSER